MSILVEPKMKSYGDKNSLSELMSSSSKHSASQKRDDSSNSSLEHNEMYSSGGIPIRYYTGVVKSFNIIEGYGFIACSEVMQEYGCDVFMHKKQYFATKVSLRIGDNVRFRLVLSKQGKPQARELSRVGEAPVAAFLRRLRARPQETEIQQVRILQPEQTSQKRKRKVSFKEFVEVCEVNDVIGDESHVDQQHAPKVITKQKHINLSPAKKFTSLLTWKEAKQNSCVPKGFTGEKKLDTCLIDKNETPSKQDNITPNRTVDHSVTEQQTQEMSSVDLTNSTNILTKKLAPSRLEKRVISVHKTPQTSKLSTQDYNKTDEATQARLEDGVINGVLPKILVKDAASTISKNGPKKVSKKRVTFKLAEDIIEDSDPDWSSGRSQRQNKKRLGMMKNFGATVRRKAKNSYETKRYKGVEASRSEGELEQDKVKELARLANETFAKLQRVQKKSSNSKISILPQLKNTKKISDSETDPAYLDWSLGFTEEESKTNNEPKTKGKQVESHCKNSNIEVQAQYKIEEENNKLDPDPLRKREEWFPKPPICKIPKVPLKAEWGPRVVLTEVQERERECSQPTHTGFLGFKEGYSLRGNDHEQCSDDFKTNRKERRGNREKEGQSLNRQQTQPVQSSCEVNAKAIVDESIAVKPQEQELPIRNYKFPRPLDGQKQKK